RILTTTQWASTPREHFMAIAASEVSPATSANARPGLSLGQAQEFTLISKLKPGGAQRMRELFREGFNGERKKLTDRIGTVQAVRFVTSDNDWPVLFVSSCDGTWDS